MREKTSQDSGNPLTGKPTASTDLGGYLDSVDRLLLEAPGDALRCATQLPFLVAHSDPGTKARAYSSLAVALLKTGDLAAGREAIAKAQEHAPRARAGIRALVQIRTVSFYIAEQRYAEADPILTSALVLAETDPWSAVLPMVFMSRGRLRYETGDFAAAARDYARAMALFPREEGDLRAAAAWNLLLNAYHLGGRDAQELLARLQTAGLRCRRRLSRSDRWARPTLPQLMICWVEGQLRASLGQHRHATQCLGWAVRGLREIGAVTQAALAALDLLGFEGTSLAQVRQVIAAIEADPQAPEALLLAVRKWTESPTIEHAAMLRAQLERRGLAVAVE